MPAWCPGLRPPGQQLARALALADVIAAQAPLGVYATLASARAAAAAIGDAATDADALARIVDLADDPPPGTTLVIAGDDMQEGLRAFVGRRPGAFTGK